MKQLFTSFAVAAAFFVNAQVTLTKDTTFGTNGTTKFLLTAEADFGQIIDTQDNKIMLFGEDVPSNISIHKNKIFKIDLNGAADTTFGVNGLLVLPDYNGSFTVIKQGTDKFLVVFNGINSNYHSTTPYNDEKAILRYNLDGTLDTSFGTNGEIRISFAGGEEFLGSNVAVLPDNSILFADTTKYMKFTTSGQLDTSYGSSGTINIANSGNLKNIGTDIYNFYSNKVTKNDISGNINSSFATGGTYSYPITGVFNPILYSNNTFGILDFDALRYFNLSSSGSIINDIALSNIDNDVDYYSGHTISGSTYFMGATLNSGVPAIVAYNSSGALQTINNEISYKETTITAGDLTSLFAKDRNLYASIDSYEGGKHYYTITKYTVAQASLGTADLIKKNGIVFENPVRSILNYKSAENVSKVELYSMDGKLVRTTTSSGASVADLPKGTYVAKVLYQNGNGTTTKLIKQ